MNKKQKAMLDSENYRFVVAPLTNDATISVQQVLRVIKNTTLTSWKQLAEFTGLRSTSDCFKVCYTANKQHALVERLQPYLTIDVDNNKAYFYDKDHKPESALPIHTPVVIKNNESESTVVYTLVPTKVLSRVSISDPLDRMLIMTLTPANGYLLGIRDITISKPGMSYVVSGSRKTLNDLLKNLHFVGTTVGTGSVIVKIDDGENDIASVVSTTISFTLNASETPSIPTMSLPTEQSATLNEVCSFDAITVADEDDKVVEVRISPFGCKLEGFKSYLFQLVPGEVRTISGRPDTVNDEISGLKIFAMQENCQIGVELLCGKTHLRDYVRFTATEGSEEEPGEEQPEENFDIEAVFSSSNYVVAGTGNIEGVAFSGTYDKSFKTKVTIGAGAKATSINNSTFTADAFALEEGEASSVFEGTLSEVQNTLGSMMIELYQNSFIKIEFPEHTGINPVTTTLTFVEEPIMEENPEGPVLEEN